MKTYQISPVVFENSAGEVWQYFDASKCGTTKTTVSSALFSRQVVQLVARRSVAGQRTSECAQKHKGECVEEQIQGNVRKSGER